MDDQSEINVDVKFWWRLHRLSCAFARVVEVKHIIEILSRLLDSSPHSHNIHVDNRHNERNVVWIDLFIKTESTDFNQRVSQLSPTRKLDHENHSCWE